MTQVQVECVRKAYKAFLMEKMKYKEFIRSRIGDKELDESWYKFLDALDKFEQEVDDVVLET